MIASQPAKQASGAEHRDRRAGESNGDKETPALAGLRLQIRVRRCRWMTLSCRVCEGVAEARPGQGPRDAGLSTGQIVRGQKINCYEHEKLIEFCHKTSSCKILSEKEVCINKQHKVKERKRTKEPILLLFCK